MSAHTPGPWTVEVVHEHPAIDAQPPRMAGWGKVNIPHAIPIEAKLEDARLIAAAPELLAACKAALGHLTDDAPRMLTALESLRAAIAKAEGGVK